MDSVYFSRRLPLRSPEAIRALDHWLHDQHPAYPRLRHCPAEARLWVRQGFDEPGCDVWILRRLHGWLWTSGVPVAVELELLLHSQETTELAIRPLNLRWPVGSKRYNELAWRAVTELGTILVVMDRDDCKRLAKVNQRAVSAPSFAA